MKLERIEWFYISAFAPIFAVFYFSPFSAVIPFYGFMLILLKHQKLVEAGKPKPTQMILGVAVILFSLFAHYAAILVYREAAFYSPANYVLHLLGLFLVFFKLPTLREAISPIFLIGAATSSTFIAAWLKPFISPFAADFARLVVGILRAFGINATIYYLGATPAVAVKSLTGRMVTGVFVYECIGVYSALVFSIILVVVLFEDPSSLRTKAAFAAVGLAGTFTLNILRVAMIFVADYFYGAEVGANVHLVIGYAIFSVWLILFLYVYSKRHTILIRSQKLWHSIKHHFTSEKTNESI